jgi:hypothetical protein
MKPMWTLRSYLEALARLGREYVVQEADGFAWPADELIDWLEWQAPERLALAVGFSGPDRQDGGVLYALDDQGAVVSLDPLYWITRCQPAQPPGLSMASPRFGE